MTQFNILAKSGRSVETCGDVNVLILDKTGTITYGNRMADAFIPVKCFERSMKVLSQMTHQRDAVL